MVIMEFLGGILVMGRVRGGFCRFFIFEGFGVLGRVVCVVGRRIDF